MSQKKAIRLRAPLIVTPHDVYFGENNRGYPAEVMFRTKSKKKKKPQNA
jgi:hypothetical protein